MRALSTLLSAALVCAACANQQEAAQTADAAGEKAAVPAAGSPEEKIQLAMSAAPPEIAQGATILDWQTMPDGQPTELRAGTNGWTCFTDFTVSPELDPMCVDGQSVKWAEAWAGKKTPALTSIGLAYMLRGDAGASLTDPYATSATADNQWHKNGPHVMVFVPDIKQLEALPASHTAGVPYVMWKGTPYAHIMVPTGAAGAH